MSPPTNDSDIGREYTTLTVSAKFRDKIRVAKTEQGLSHKDYVRQYIPIETEL